MGSKMEGLPTEIHLQIWEHLSTRDLGRLNQCNKTIHASLDPYMLAFPLALSRLMRWGCSHADQLCIRKALSYGADIDNIEAEEEFDVSHIKSGPVLLTNPGKRIVKISTLSLAAENGDEITFQFLLDRGARMEPSGTKWPRSEPLSKFLFQPHRLPFLLHCIKNGSKRDIRGLQVHADSSLLDAVKSNASPEACRIWLNLGANPTNIVRAKDLTDKIESALALAALSGSVSLTKFLIDSTPSSPFQYPEYHGTHTWRAAPIFAAVHYLATSGVTSTVDLLLQAGEDINAEATDHELAAPDVPTFRLHHTWYPFVAYVLFVDCARRPEPGTLSPSQGLQYLFHQGAYVKQLHASRPGYSHYKRTFPLPWYFWRRWGGLESLVNDETYSVLKILMRKGACKGNVADMLMSPQTGFDESPPNLSEAQRKLIPNRWGTMVDLLTTERNLVVAFEEGLNSLLFRYLMHVFRQVLDFNPDPPKVISVGSRLVETTSSAFDARHPETIRRLIAKGADIRRGPEHGPYKGVSILEAIFRSSKHIKTPNPVAQKLKHSFVAGLIQLGAKPLKDNAAIDETGANEELSGEFVPNEILEQRKWLHSLQGLIAEEKASLWTLETGFSLDESCVAIMLAYNAAQG